MVVVALIDAAPVQPHDASPTVAHIAVSVCAIAGTASLFTWLLATYSNNVCFLNSMMEKKESTASNCARTLVFEMRKRKMENSA